MIKFASGLGHLSTVKIIMKDAIILLQRLGVGCHKHTESKQPTLS